jgi:hypothetical protein
MSRSKAAECAKTDPSKNTINKRRFSIQRRKLHLRFRPRNTSWRRFQGNPIKNKSRHRVSARSWHSSCGGRYRALDTFRWVGHAFECLLAGLSRLKLGGM